MSMIKTIEKTIHTKEHLDNRYQVDIVREDGTVVRSDKHGFHPWPYKYAHDKSSRLSVLQRACQQEYPEHTLRVRDKENKNAIVHGNTRLKSLRKDVNP